MSKKSLKVKLEHFRQVLPTESGYTVENLQAKGRIAIPEHAGWLWSLAEGPHWSWSQDNHYTDEACTACSNGRTCTQHVTVWSRSRTILVVHDYRPKLLC